MPTYLYLCPACNIRESDKGPLVPAGRACSNCGGDMRRDWVGENASSNFHPSRDLYAQDLSRRAAKKSARHF